MKKETKGITLIALVITIIVLLILAGVVIQTLTGDNGLLQKAGEATEKNSIGTEKEQIALAATAMEIENETDIDKKEKLFQDHLDKYAGENKTKVYATDSNYTIHFLETNRLYTINEDGNIVEEDITMLEEDSVAGVFDGAGTQASPYKIMSIEDLVYFSKEVCNGNSYSGKYIELGKPLDFKSKLSYKNMQTSYNYAEDTTSYIVDENSETTLMKLCTQNMGFIPIGNSSRPFKGIFDGKGNKIKNLYESRSEDVGLFGCISGANVSNINVSINIKSSDNYSGRNCW